MKGIAVKRLVLLALLFLTLSYVQVSSIALAQNNPPTTPSVPAGETSGLSGTYLSYTTKASDPDGNQLKYTFDWGDGTSSTTCLVNQGVTVKVFHKWDVSPESTETFNIKVKAADNYGLASGWSGPLSVAVSGSDAQDQVDTNKPPSTPSVPSGSTSGSSGTSYSYSTKGIDPDGDFVMYTFDWGDGTTSTTSLVASGATASASHSWTVGAGTTKTFSVRAMATDKSGMASSWSSSLLVTITGPVPLNNPPGTPSAPSGSKSGSSGISYTYSTSAVDPDENRVKYTFDWGDGTTSTTSLVASGATASASHSWTVAAGSTKTFSVRAMATDESGKSSGWSSELSVAISGPAGSSSSNPPARPSMPWGCLAGYTMYSYTYETKAIDPDGDPVKFIFDWGDGTTTTTDYVASGALARASHQWKGKDSGGCQGFNITAKAIDVHGMESVWSNPLPVSMVNDPVNHPPTIPTVTGPTNGVSGVPLQVSVVSNDPDGHKIKYTIHWGDTIEDTGYIPSGQAATVSHVWNVPAGTTRTYSIIALAVDQYGMMCPSPRWSTPLVVSITGPSIKSQVLGLKVKNNEIVQPEEPELVYAQTNESNSADAQTIEIESEDAQTDEIESEYSQTDEIESEDAQTDEIESEDAKTYESDSIDEQTDEDVSANEQLEGECNIAVDDIYLLASNSSTLKIVAPGVLENDQYGGEGSLYVVSYSQPAHAASFAMNSDGSFTYTSNNDYCGEDSFTYKTTDGICESNEATVTIFVDCDSNMEVTY